MLVSRSNFIDFVDENDPVILGTLNGVVIDVGMIDQFVRFLFDEDFASFFDGHGPLNLFLRH
ncbi:Uncharacterised protein [Mycobacteroides abscessus subsp. abscessus]|nr:Uncharacterised protein [Mycobacteroides abscessus subsp. abscessus]